MFNSIFITIKWQDITRHSLTVVVMFLSHMYPDRTTTWKIWQYLGFTFITRGQFWPSGIVVACVCPSASPSVTKFVRAITHYPFQLGSPNLDQRCKRPWLRSLLFCGTIDRELQGQIALQSQNLPHFELVHVITHHQLKLQFPNLEQKMHLSTVQIPTNFGLDWNGSSIQFLISNPDQIELFMYIIGIL